MNPIDRDAIRAFVERAREPVEAARRSYWAERKQRIGLREVMRVAEQLRDQARVIDPEYPTEAEREADLQTHARVSALLAQVAPARRVASPRPRARGVRARRT